MARQVIFVSQTIFDTLAEHRFLQQSKADPVFHIRPLSGEKVCLGVRTSLTALGYGTPAPTNLDDFVLVIAAATEPDPLFQPLPLPDDIVSEILTALQSAIDVSIEDLSGHERMELSEALEDARAGTFSWPSVTRLPTSDYERRLVEAAIWAEEKAPSRLDLLDVRHAALRDAAIHGNLLQPLRSLSLAGAVADALHLAFSDLRQGDLESAAENVREAQAALVLAEADADAYRANGYRCWKRYDRPGMGMHPFRLYELYDMVSPDPESYAKRPLWRDQNHMLPGGLAHSVAAEDIEKALLALTSAIDARLLGDFHPVTRAAIAMYELLRISPAATGNERAACHIFASMLEADGFFSLPISLILHRHWLTIHEAFRNAALIGRRRGFVWQMLFYYEQAIQIGERIMAHLPSWRTRIVEHLASDGVNPVDSHRLADLLAGNPLLEGRLLCVLDGDELQDVAPSLHAAGFLDRLEIDGKTWWSPSLARKLAASWTCWPTRS